MNRKVLAVLLIVISVLTLTSANMLLVAQASPIPNYFTFTSTQGEFGAGNAFTSPLVLTVYAANGNLMANYLGSVYFTSSDLQAVLPFTASSPYTFTSADQGVHIFSGSDFILRTPGEQNITVIDASTGISANLRAITPSGIMGDDVGISVLNKLVFISGASQTLIAGQMSNLITIERQDGNGNPFTMGWNIVGLYASRFQNNVVTESTTGHFYYTNGSLITPQTNNLLIPQGSSSVSFYYQDGTAGNWNITASSTGSLTYVPDGATVAASTTFTYADDSTVTLYSVGQALCQVITTFTINPNFTLTPTSTATIIPTPITTASPIPPDSSTIQPSETPTAPEFSFPAVLAVLIVTMLASAIMVTLKKRKGSDN